jgi:hypothetical protein
VSLSSGRLSNAKITLLNYYTFEAKAFKIIDTVILILELRRDALCSTGTGKILRAPFGLCSPSLSADDASLLVSRRDATAPQGALRVDID